MRDILFRGKPTKEVLENESLCKTLPIKDGFVYGNLIYNDKQPYIVGPIADVNDEYCSMEWWCPVKPETVGQFTGLVDKNGKHVFEGDILRFPAKDEYEKTTFVGYEVFYHDNDCADKHIGFQMDRMLFYGHLCGGECRAKLLPKYTSQMVIIGNIHENPELLGGK